MSNLEEYKEYPDFQNYDDIDYNNDDDDSKFLNILAIISKWFIRIGIVIAIILFIYYIVTGKITSGLMFLLGLVVAFFFGYGFMFLLDHFVDSNDE